MSQVVTKIEKAFNAFVQEVRMQAESAGEYNEERLTAPTRDLLNTIKRLLGINNLTIVDKTTVKSGLSEGSAVGVPDLSLYDQAGRLVLCVELKAPGKGANPTQFTSNHDKSQWKRYRALPNLIYTDGNSWSLWHDGEPSTHQITVCDDITAHNPTLSVDSDEATHLFQQAFNWLPAPIRTTKQLALECAKYCKMLRHEAEHLPSGLLSSISRSWKKLLFPDLEDAQFIDAYAQTVTFALLTAGGLGIKLDIDIDDSEYDRLDLSLRHIATNLEQRRGLLGKALSLLTGDAKIRNQLSTYLEILLTIVRSVDWSKIRTSDNSSSTGWLHFYEDFLEAYDPELRKMSGSYYTPTGIVEWMTKFTDALLDSCLGMDSGYANGRVKVVDPATGTGTFLLGILDRIAERVAINTGEGAVAKALDSAVGSRLIGFEIQSGPYAVAQLRLVEHLRSLNAGSVGENLRIYLADTLDDPKIENANKQLFFEALGESRAAANKVKKEESVVVVIGNPPYLERARGKGGWVEDVILQDWKAPSDWGVSAHTKNLSNLYIYFWRWAAWKVFENSQIDNEENQSGIVSFITPTVFLTGDGFQKMRTWLRQWCSDIWVLHLTPEGHQAPSKHQIFEGMRQPVAVITAVRRAGTSNDSPAKIRYHQVPSVTRPEKIAHIGILVDPAAAGWQEIPKPATSHEWRNPFTPPPKGVWNDMLPIEDLLPWNGSGVMVGRTWPIAPDESILIDRWVTLLNAETDKDRNDHFVPHERDRPINKGLDDNLIATIPWRRPIREEKERSVSVEPYGYRSFDRQFIIRDKRVINQPNPSFWATHSDHQIYLKVPALYTDGTRQRIANSKGTIVSFSEAIPDMDYLSGSRAGRVHPLWRDKQATIPNITPRFLDFLTQRYDRDVAAEDLFAYIASVTAHPGYTEIFRKELQQAMGVRVPITANGDLFTKAVKIGRTILRLHTYGKRLSSSSATKPCVKINPPRVDQGMPDEAHSLSHDSTTNTLLVHGITNGKPHEGKIINVSADVFEYTVGTMNVVESWFGYRKTKPAGRRASPLDHKSLRQWPPHYTSDFINLIQVLTLLTAEHSKQKRLLQQIMSGDLLTPAELTSASLLPVSPEAQIPPPSFKKSQQTPLSLP